VKAGILREVGPPDGVWREDVEGPRAAPADGPIKARARGIRFRDVLVGGGVA
jgi:hypothetical protein